MEDAANAFENEMARYRRVRHDEEREPHLRCGRRRHQGLGNLSSRVRGATRPANHKRVAQEMSLVSKYQVGKTSMRRAFQDLSDNNLYLVLVSTSAKGSRMRLAAPQQ